MWKLRSRSNRSMDYRLMSVDYRYGMLRIMGQCGKYFGLRLKAIARWCVVGLWIGLMVLGLGSGGAIASPDTMPGSPPGPMHRKPMHGSTGGMYQGMPDNPPPMECCTHARNHRRAHDTQVVEGIENKGCPENRLPNGAELPCMFQTNLDTPTSFPADIDKADIDPVQSPTQSVNSQSVNGADMAPPPQEYTQESLDVSTESHSAPTELTTSNSDIDSILDSDGQHSDEQHSDGQPLKTYSLTLIPDNPRQQITLDPPATRIKVTMELGNSAVRCGDRLDSYRTLPGKPLTIERDADTAMTQFWAQNSGGGDARLRIEVME